MLVSKKIIIILLSLALLPINTVYSGCPPIENNQCTILTEENYDKVIKDCTGNYKQSLKHIDYTNILPYVNFERIEYAKVQNTNLILDLLTPKNANPSKKYPLICFLHGGAWHKRNVNPGILAKLVDEGYVVAVIYYRLSCQTDWPGPIEDCKVAIKYLKVHSERYPINPNKIGVWGTSAGGYLASLIGTSDENEWIGSEHEITDYYEEDWTLEKVQAVTSHYGPTDLRNLPGHDQFSPECVLFGLDVDESLSEKLPQGTRVSPVNCASSDDPPFLIAHGTKDTVIYCGQSLSLHNALEDQNVPAFIRFIENAEHGFEGVTDARSKQYNDWSFNQMLKFYRLTLKMNISVDTMNRPFVKFLINRWLNAH